MTSKLALAIASGLALMTAAPLAQAAVISITDANNITESVSVQVAAPFQSTSPGQFSPGTGSVVDFTSAPSLAANNMRSGSTGNTGTAETVQFDFINQINWGSDVYLYRQFREPANEGGGISDLFVIQGRAGTPDDIVNFLSDVTGSLSPTELTAAQVQALVPRIAGSSATPSNLGTVDEVPGFQLADNTGVDQYYITSLVPEPGSLALLGTALVGFGLARRRRKAA